MALVLIKSDSVGFFVQISSQNREANISHQTGETEKLTYSDRSITYAHSERSTDFFRLNVTRLVKVLQNNQFLI